jgi:hypothetical protein
MDLYDLKVSSCGRPAELEFKADEIASLPQNPGQRGPPSPKSTILETVGAEEERLVEVVDVVAEMIGMD